MTHFILLSSLRYSYQNYKPGVRDFGTWAAAAVSSTWVTTSRSVYATNSSAHRRGVDWNMKTEFL